ncbi:MAG: DoxX family protein [Actinobacteria bacterium]|nr:DoxX family protein [Actinomycetota bacterium]
MSDQDVVDGALALARAWVGVVMFAHGWRHLKSVRSGPGMVNWFESLGLKPGKLHAWNVTLTELAVGPALIFGLFTPIAYGGTAAIVLVALVTNHKKNGFWSNNPGEGWEYTATLAVLSIALGSLGPGHWSLDDAFGFSFVSDLKLTALEAFVVGIGGTTAFLTAFWRPPKETAKAA